MEYPNLTLLKSLDSIESYFWNLLKKAEANGLSAEFAFLKKKYLAANKALVEETSNFALWSEANSQGA